MIVHLLNKKRIIALLIALCCGWGTAWASYSVSYTYQGNTLYYSCSTSTQKAWVVFPGNYDDDGGWGGYTEPSGSLIIPSSFTISSGTFAGTYNVVGISNNAFEYCDDITTVTIPSSVTSIGEYAFSDCRYLTTVNGGNSVVSIQRGAFAECRRLASFVVSNATTSIGDNAFYGCSSLTTITIGNSLTSIASSAFYSTYLNNIYYTGTIQQWCSISSIANVNRSNCNFYINNQLVTDLVIPETITSIPWGAFKNMTCLTSVTIPSSVTTIGSSAFDGCTNLSSVNYTGTLAQWCSISVSNNAFSSHDFYINNQLITDLVIPQSVTTIKQNAFAYCSSLTSVTIPSTVTTINSSAFSNCDNMSTVYFTGTIAQWLSLSNKIPYSNVQNLYINNQLITDLVIPETVTQIPESAFSYASFLNSVTIPNSVTSIGNWAFSGCTGLTSITLISGTPPSISSYTFNHVPTNTPIHVPCGSASAYQSANYWSSFTNYQEGFGITVLANPNEGGAVSGGGSFCDNTSCTITAAPATGYTFTNWTRGSQIVSTDPSYTFIVTSSESYTANFTINSYAINASASPTAGGSITGTGNYDHGSVCALTASPSSGYAFLKWMEDGAVVSTDATYSFTVTRARNLTAVFTKGHLPGVFTVANNEQVCFSVGNLQYKASTNTWRFAPNQWDNCGAANTNISSTYNNWIDLFGWGTSGYNHGATNYQPWSTTTNSSKYYAYGQSSYNLYDQTGKADWGYNAISNGGNTENSWRTLKLEEWNWVLNTRSTVSGIRYAKATVNSVKGLILLPDNWNSSYYSLNNTNQSNASFSSNYISQTQWATLEQHGAVFLPAAGSRSGITVTGINTGGYYHASSAGTNTSASYFMSFLDGSLSTTQTERYQGRSVRLVCTPQDYVTINASSNPSGGGTVAGAGLYEIGSSCTLTATPATGYNFSKWIKNGTQVSTNANYTFTVTGAASYVAVFTKKSYTISASASPSAGGTVSGAGSYQYGTTCTLTATANSGYAFVDWTKNGTQVSTNPTYSFTVNAAASYVANFIQTFAITATANPTAGGSVTGGGTYNSGASCTLTATPATGYSFVNWTESGSQVSNNASYQFMVTGARTLVANFAPNTYTVTLNTNNGTINSGNVTSYTYGVGATLPTDVTRTGYTFGGWYDNANLTGTAVTFISTTATGNKTFWAKWTINSYAIGASANPTEGGTVSGAGSYNYGASCTLTATPATGYNFTKWTKNNTQVSTNTNYTFTVNAAGTYVAQFTKKTYTISASANPTAGGTVTGAGTYEHGSTCTLTASPSTGYSFVNWTSENSQVSTNANYQFTVTGARTLVANFAPNTYTVTLNTNNGTINSGNVTSYTYGEGATLPTDVTRTGYTFGGWYDNANLTGTAVTAISNTATGNKTFWAKWTINSYAIGASANPTEGGTVSGAGSYNYGASCTLTATPATGYTFTNWKKGTQVVSTDASYQFTVTEAASYTATFTLNSYAITASANPTAGGTVTGAGTYNHGSTASLTATANTGYTFVNWTENGQQVSTNPTYSFTVTGAKNLVANFSLNSYPIAASANPNNGGTVTGAGTYDHGETATLTAMAAEGYSFVNWTEGTQVVSNNATYGFTVTGARTLVANFSLNSYTLTINYKYDNGTQAAPTHTESVNYNAAYNVTSPVINGYTADQLVVSGTMGADDVTVNVIYSINSYTLTINYKYADGTTAAATHTESVDYNATYSVASPDITGYTADQPMVTGTMGTEDVTVDVTYNINSYTLTINYKYADGTTAAATHTESVDYNATYSVASPDITGYTADQPMVTGTMGTENVTVDVTYSIDSYTLTINYLYADGTPAATTHTESVNYNATYSVASPDITGYTADQPMVTGTMGTENVTVNVTYSINSYTLTINYLYADGTPAATTHTESVNYNATYSVASPDITGYTADQPVVTGTMGTENVTVDVTYSINSYTLTINYLYADGTTAATTHTENVNYNATYSVASPDITGYTADQLMVTGTMGTENVTVDVTYSIDSYTLTINYLYADGTPAATTHTESVNYNATYSVASPDITGYTADQPMVTGTMGTENVTVNVTYSINSYTLTINYLYADGTPAATTHTESVNYNATYSVASPDITGYTADQPMVTGTMGTENVTVNVTYSINSYTLTINYKYADGTTAAATHTENVNYNATYSVASPVITGYTADQPVVTGTMGTEDVTVDVTYSINSYTLTINYLYADGTTAATTHTENVNYNATYSVASPDITGYTADQPMVTGTMGTENVTVNVTYSINSYSITVSASEGGSATGDGTYNYGATATLMAAANEGYTFVNWTENGNVVSTNATYSFTVLSDRDLVANFQIESYTIVVSATEGGTVTGGGTYDYGTNVTLSATAMDGYIFVNWTDDGIEVSTEANYSFIVNSNRTLVAHFEEYHNANHWIPVSSGSSGVMTLLAKIQINGVDQNSDQLELGVFCGTECRGSKIAHLLDIPSENLHYYLVDPLVYGDSGETFSFKLYNHEIGEEMDLIAPDPIAYTENGYGELRDPYVLNFLSTVQITASVDPENAGTVTGTGNHTIGTSCTLSAIANEGFQFMNWTLNGAVVSTEASYTFMVSESSHYVAHFAFVHSQPMTNGWNWWSTYIEMEGVDGLGMLKNSLGASCVRIQARYGYLDNLGSSWYGSLTSIENEQMYKIRTNAPCTAVIVGNAALPQNHPIIINEGWNWIGFPCSETTSIGTALQSFGPEVNDLIKSREGYASYLGNNYWYGSINAFEPGKGYMYKSNSSSSKTLQFTAGRGEENIAMNDHTGSRLFEPVVESFASNMTVTAVVDVDGEELRSEEYEVSAFVGNECRGSVKLMYIEPLDRYIAFLLVFGEDGEEITFTLTDGRGVCISEDVMVYSNDGMVGTLTEPANLHFGLDGLWDNEQMQIHVYPNPSKNIFNIEGVNLRRIEVVDGFGQVILSSEIEGDHIQINLGDRAIGTYLLRVITDSGIVSKKLIKTL